MPRVHKKQHRPKGGTSTSTTAASASPAAPAAPPAPAEQLTDALTTLTLQPQVPTPPQSAQTAQPSPTPPKTPAASDRLGPLPPPDPKDPWAQILWCHDTQGLSYLDAAIQVTDDQCGLAKGLDRDAALARAAMRVGECCGALYGDGPKETETKASPYHRAETGATVIETALREALTTLPVDHTATLTLTFYSGALLYRKKDWEAAARKFKWLIPRAAKLGMDGWEDGFSLRFQAAKCLAACGKYEEALPLLLAAIEQRRKTHGAEDERLMGAVQSVLDCNEKLHSLPPETAVPLLQLFLTYLRGVGEEGDEPLNKYLRMLHTRQMGLRDFAAAKETSRELMQVVKRLSGFKHHNYWTAAREHAADLALCGDTAKAISILSQSLNHHMSTCGPENYHTCTSASLLGQTYAMADRYAEAVGVFERTWPASERGLKHDARSHVELYNEYHNSLLCLGRVADAKKLRKEAKRRGLAVDRVHEDRAEMRLGCLYGDSQLPFTNGLCPCCAAKNEEEQERQEKRTQRGV